jgi:ketol-acid reductoisomerase
MPAKVYYDADADMANLKGKTVAIIGYGSQGHAHAQNLRDSGVKVVVGQRPGGANYELAKSHGFEPVSAGEAAKQGDLVNILLPDEVQADVYKSEIREQLGAGDILMCSHGFNVHFGQIEPPEGVDLLLVAPKGPGHLVRSEFVAGGGVPSLIATRVAGSKTTDDDMADESSNVFKLGLAYAKGIGGTRGGVIRTTFAEETETDLFGEQAVLCGGLSELVKAGFETLVEAGYQPEMAYFECLHELKLIVDLMNESGIAGMRFSISETAEWGDVSVGPKIINESVKNRMRKQLKEIESGKFAREWIKEADGGCKNFNKIRKEQAKHQIEKVGERLRSTMSWIKQKKLAKGAAQASYVSASK